MENVIHLPVWAIILICSLASSILGYIWVRLESRIKDIERERKIEIAKGLVLTVEGHNIICGGNMEKIKVDFEKAMESLKELLMIRFQSLDEKMDMNKQLIESQIRIESGRHRRTSKSLKALGK